MSVKFLYTFLNDTATITSSSSTGSLVDDNVIDDFVQRKWRTTGDTAEWIKFDLGSAKAITAVSIFGHNLTAAATITLEGNAADAWGAPTYSAVMSWGEFCIAKLLTETFQWWRITFVDAANPDGYIEMGRICMGVYVETSINITATMIKMYVDPSVKKKTEGRQVHAILKTKYRIYKISYDVVDRTLQNQMETLYRQVGNTEPFVFILDSGSYLVEDTIYCLITSSLTMALQVLGNGDINLLLEEQVS